MKMPERSRSRVGHSPQNSLFDIIWSLRWDQTSLHSAQLVHTKNLPGDLDLLPTTLTYNPSLAMVRFNSHTKKQGHSSNGLAVRVLTHTHRDRQTESRL